MAPLKPAPDTPRARARHLTTPPPSLGALRAQRKFLRYFPGGFYDQTYLDWERDYKARAAERFRTELSPKELRSLIRAGRHAEVAARAVAIEARTNLLYSFEKMALRDAVRSRRAAALFAEGLLAFTTGLPNRSSFERWCDAVETLPRRQTRVFTWPVVTVFGFLARPDVHLFLKPTVTKRAAAAYGFEFHYASRPNWETYASLLELAALVRRDARTLRSRDMIDLQSFLWVQGSDEYPPVYAPPRTPSRR
jgi:hypothetical protein